MVSAATAKAEVAGVGMAVAGVGMAVAEVGIAGTETGVAVAREKTGAVAERRRVLAEVVGGNLLPAAEVGMARTGRHNVRHSAQPSDRAEQTRNGR